MAVTEHDQGGRALSEELAGLDALELAAGPGASLGRRIWAATWPKLLAVAIGLGFWQVVVWSGWKPDYALPPPADVFRTLWDMLRDGTMTDAILRTMQRAVIGYALAFVIGVFVGAVVSRSKVLRAGVGSLITGLQTMPSIAWLPLAILMFQISEQAIMFVIIIGAAPAIANGLLNGVDHIPPVLLRAGKVLGAKGFQSFWYVIAPAALPNFIGGMKQGWAFAWRSLMAGELIIVVAGNPSIGSLLSDARTFADAPALVAVMIVILVIGIIVDSFFTAADKRIRRRYGLIDTASN